MQKNNYISCEEQSGSMTKKTLSRMIAAALLPLLIVACDKTPQPPLAFGASAWPGYEPVYLARELGYLKEANLRLDEYKAPQETEDAFRSRKIHLAALTLDRALLLRRDIPDLKIILLFDAAPSKRMDVMVTRDEYIGQYHQEMQQLLQGWRKTLDYMHSNPDQAAQAMARREGVPPAQFNAMLQGMELYGLQRNQQEMIGEPPPIGTAIEAVQRALLNQGKLEIGVDPSMLLDTTLLAESPK
jgi:ABC-type nitrate/sulfonate/bicarbonate transport system substrate-binding protein